MKNLVDVVATLDMCRKLEEHLPGKFSKSVFKWYCDGKKWWVVPREFDVFSEDGFTEYPAVTALEIMEKIVCGFLYVSNKKWKAGIIGDVNSEELHKNPAMAAAKVILKIDKDSLL